ncbi:SDR family NAD(P)-dependent oxidoreductase [Butyricimonas faecalis]|uniref:SDR family oxidoreductase n=2 Tax=Bacteroidales TaxID=171549 RepID=A0A3S9VVC9_9BACT|nr:SDR family oxidoreductase [Butyricimonas faecalis]AZS30517.1 SDR family oxidoreductase [Butyricimonas faecalis]
MKTVFITGGSTGIGAASVKKFIQQGWNVGFMDINEEAARERMEEINRPEQLIFVPGDTRNRADIHRAVEETVKRFGRLDSVVANAGIHRCNTLLDISDEELDLMIQTNIYGTVNTLREAVPHIIRAGGGTVVINASDQWFVGKAHSFGYGLTKGALGQITRSLSIDLGPKNIRVNAVCAGTIHTPLVDNLFEKFAQENHCSIDDYWREENALYARGSAGRPEEVAEMVYFLASDASSFCTGGHYLVDGGLVAH